MLLLKSVFALLNTYFGVIAFGAHKDLDFPAHW